MDKSLHAHLVLSVWVLWWATVAGLFLQVLSSRLGVVTGHNLAQVCRHEYPASVRYTLWVMMEIAIIASDIQVGTIAGVVVHPGLVSMGPYD